MKTLNLNFFLCFFLISIFYGCSELKIITPSEEQEYIVTPSTLEVVHSGCGIAVPDSFVAWLDYGKENKMDISDQFSYSNGVWSASNITLPLGSHKLLVLVDLKEPNRCVHEKAGERKFYISQPTCLKGTAYKYWHTTPDIKEPAVNIHINVYRSGTKTLLSTVVSDSEGKFCIDNLPIGLTIDLKVGPKDGFLEGIDTGIEPTSCPDCKDVEILIKDYPR